MTKEEREKAIKTLQKLQAAYNDKYIDYEGANDAYNMAIEALRTEPYFWEKCPYYEPDIMFDGKEEYDWGKCTYKTKPCVDRKNCPHRHENGNCLSVGGFCLAVDDKHCQLKKEPCVDAISRSEAMNVLDALYLDGESAQGFTADTNGDCLIGKYKAIEILDELPSVQPEPKTGYISIADVMSVFDDFMCGEVDEDGTETFLEMLKDKAESEDGQLPSVQPEIIRCHQCKYAEVADSEDSQDGYTCQFHRGSIWFSGSYCSWAERRQDG